MTNIIFLGFEQHCGKDTVGEILVKNYNYKRVSFADAVKLELAEKLNIDVKILQQQGPEKEKYRSQMIEFAESERKKNPYVWINKAFEPYMTNLKTFKPNLNLVVTDFRRDAEVEWYYSIWTEIQKRNSLYYKNPKYKAELDLKLFHIIRPELEGKDKDTLTHKTIGLVYGIELVYPGFINSVIYNDSTIENLELKIQLAMQNQDNTIFGQKIN